MNYTNLAIAGGILFAVWKFAPQCHHQGRGYQRGRGDRGQADSLPQRLHPYFLQPVFASSFNPRPPCGADATREDGTVVVVTVVSILARPVGRALRLCRSH